MPKKTQPKAKPTPRPAGPKRTHEQTEKAAAIPDSDDEADEDGALVEPGDCNVDPSETDENRAVKSRKGLYRNRGTVTGMEKVFERSDDMSAFPRKADAYTHKMENAFEWGKFGKFGHCLSQECGSAVYVLTQWKLFLCRAPLGKMHKDKQKTTG
ncbi:hypothetical protein FIBSPDRAFT_983251 [Athelia psychrophila]|uniref:Uncharacterized protein n=1 Tax=Athelia psychrophila TaxID=1759441 RepID=A0A166C1D4_9AGAM|nr:hypothetical protein FIBSPDRAFT_983251 [Fibularhizoctonia sp. CBS 109695]